MSNHLTDFDELIDKARQHLVMTLRYRAGSSRKHQRNWRHIGRYMRSHGITKYNIKVEQKVLSERFKSKRISSLNRHEKEFYNSAKMLTDFFLNGTISLSPRMVRNTYKFKGVVGKVISEYILYKKTERVSPNTLRYYYRYFLQFSDFCFEEKLISIKQVDLELIIKYLKYIRQCKVFLTLLESNKL